MFNFSHGLYEQGSYPFSETFISKAFPGLRFSRTSSLFPGLSGPGKFQIRFQDFPSFQGPAQTLYKLFYVFNFQECERIAKFLYKLEIQQA